MGLKVWLPLNGTLDNLGCTGTVITSIGTDNEWISNGKIGNNCLHLIKASGTIAIPSMVGSKQMSFAYWVKLNTAWSTNWLDGIRWYSTDGSANHQSRSEFYYLTSSPKIGAWYKGGSNSGYTITIGNWYHVTFTINYELGISDFYLNGKLQGHTTNVDTTHYIQTGNFLIGDNGVDINMNDVRIYDHCLSAAEVREISQGLVLHYKLDNFQGGYGNPNLITGYDTSFLSYPDGAVTLFTNQMNSGTQEIVSNISNAKKCLHLHSNGGSNRQYRILSAISGKSYTISVDYYSTSNQTTPLHCELNGGNYSWTVANGQTYNTPGQWIRLSATYTTLTSNATLYYFIQCSNGTDCYVKNFKIEEGTSATNWTPDSTVITVIEDSSGYNHNGTINGNIAISSDTNRYNYSAQFDGVDDSITVPYNTICPENIFTLNLWFKKDALGSKNYETLFGGPSGFEMDTRSGSATALSLYMASTRSGKRNLVTGLSLGNWYMITMTRDGTKEKYYVNGIFQSEIDAKSMPNGTYRIGAWASNTGQNYYGLISDFRIYCTALDADAIRQLYEVGAKVDNKGNLHTFELSESNNGRELLAVPLTTSYGNRTNIYTNYNANGEITLTGGSSIGSNYIKINPTGSTYYYDFEVSIDANNQVYIGFERFDAAKTSRSNSACVYAIAPKPSTALSHAHYHGTVNIGTAFDANTPVDTIAVRILNDWSGANGRSMTVHKISLREVSTLQNTKINKYGQAITTELIEMNDKFRVHKNGIIETNEIVES